PEFDSRRDRALPRLISIDLPLRSHSCFGRAWLSPPEWTVRDLKCCEGGTTPVTRHRFHGFHQRTPAASGLHPCAPCIGRHAEAASRKFEAASFSPCWSSHARPRPPRRSGWSRPTLASISRATSNSAEEDPADPPAISAAGWGSSLISNAI